MEVYGHRLLSQVYWEDFATNPTVQTVLTALNAVISNVPEVATYVRKFREVDINGLLTVRSLQGGNHFQDTDVGPTISQFSIVPTLVL